MAVNIRFRPAGVSDAAVLRQICWPQRSLEETRSLLQGIIDKQAQSLAWGIIAETDVVAGFGLLTRWGAKSEISDLAVVETMRSSGIGTQIVEHLLTIARDQRIQRVEIGAVESNTAALSLYRRLGFSDPRRIVIDGEEPAIYLTMTLD